MKRLKWFKNCLDGQNKYIFSILIYHIMTSLEMQPHFKCRTICIRIWLNVKLQLTWYFLIESKYNHSLRIKFTANPAFTRDWTKSISWILAHNAIFVFGGCLQGAPNCNLSFGIFPLCASTANFSRSSNALSMAGLTTLTYSREYW